MRFAKTMLVVACVISSPALARDVSRYYGPKHGAMGEGYKHSVQKDGSWRIVTEYHVRDPLIALDAALYRAAEMARDEGHRYVRVLSGYGSSSYAVANGFVFARPADTPEAPTQCKDKRCYTADVTRVLYLLSGPTGNEPGLARPTSVDAYGRQVTISGYGIGAVSWADR